MFGRDLILEGLQRPSGEGDVVMWPENHGDVQIVLFALSSPTGQAVLECDRGHLEHFLRRTFDIVAVGDESAAIDIDACINLILREGIKGV